MKKGDYRVEKRHSSFEGKNFIGYHLVFSPFEGFETSVKLTGLKHSEKDLLDMLVKPEDDYTKHIQK